MDTNQLLDRVVQGESSAVAALLTRYEDRLRRMVQVRLDPRLSARLDPSDIVQDTLTEAHQRLLDYAADRRMPFYPWLRGIAWDKLVEMKRRHVAAERRSVSREVSKLDLSGDSRMILVERLMALEQPPSEQVIRQELRERVQNAIDQLSQPDREVIILKHLEELSVPEIAAVLGTHQEAIYSRYRRAVQRIHRLLSTE